MDIPSIFNKPDFLGILLPGYIGVMLAVALFFPDLAPVKQSQGLSLDFFSAIVFLIAGPALGYTLRQLHRTLYTMLSIPKEKRGPRMQALDQYYALRIAMSDSEKNEMDMSEGQYDFDISTGIILLAVALYFSIKNALLFDWKPLTMIGMSIILFIAGYLERKEVFLSLYRRLLQKYSLFVSVFYNVLTEGNDFATMNIGGFVRYGESAFTSSSVLVGRKLKSWKVRLRKTRNETPYGIVTAKIRSARSDWVAATFIEAIDSSLLDIEFDYFTFTLTKEYVIKEGDRILVEYNGRPGVDIEIWDIDKFDSTNTRRIAYDGTAYTGGPGDVTGAMSSR